MLVSLLLQRRPIIVIVIPSTSFIVLFLLVIKIYGIIGFRCSPRALFHQSIPLANWKLFLECVLDHLLDVNLIIHGEMKPKSARFGNLFDPTIDCYIFPTALWAHERIWNATRQTAIDFCDEYRYDSLCSAATAQC